MKSRSNEPELMDDLSLSPDILSQALQDVSRVNRLLGGNNSTFLGINTLLQQYPKQKHFIIADVGCGDGTQLRELAIFFRKRQLTCSLIGIDVNEKSLAIGRSLSVDFPEISFKNHDVLELTTADLQCDIMVTTLTMHHFTDQEITMFLKHFYELCRLGVVVNDLHRSRLAYVLFQIFSIFFVKSAVAKNDGLVSIQRGFKKKELQQFSRALGFSNFSIRWKWAFRYLWIIHKPDLSRFMQ